MADSTPYTKSYVLRATARHMRRCIDISIRKTNERWPEFKDIPEKSKEVMETLMVLHNMRNAVDQFQVEYAAEFKDNSNG